MAYKTIQDYLDLSGNPDRLGGEKEQRGADDLQGFQRKTCSFVVGI